MLNSRFLLILLLVATMATSCMSTKLVANYDSDSVVHHKATKVTYLWGIIVSKDIPAKCESKTLCQVRTETNIGYIAISFITLGIVVPQKMVWDCCPSEVKEEIID